MSNDHTITDRAIKARAQQYYEDEGRPEGKSLGHWLRAERELRGEANSSDPAGDIPASTPETSASSGEELS
jgi:hypothetical protein